MNTNIWLNIFIAVFLTEFTSPYSLNTQRGWHTSKLCEINLNCITNNFIRHICVTWQGTNYELPEDDTTVSKHVGGV